MFDLERPCKRVRSVSRTASAGVCENVGLLLLLCAVSLAVVHAVHCADDAAGEVTG